MDVRTGPGRRDAGAGFTLVELLLTVGLLLLLLGAVVFNFSGLQRGAPFDEGLNQVEALLRFARAHAANSGRQVQITFEEDVGGGLIVPLGNLRLLWEPDPVARPGFFEPLVEAEEFVRGITERLSIEGVRLVDGDSFEPHPVDPAGAPTGTTEGDSLLVTFPPVAFFPDGSSDSAEIILSSRSEEDPRRIALRLQGITGSMHRKLITDEANGLGPESPPPSAEAAGPANENPVP